MKKIIHDALIKVAQFMLFKFYIKNNATGKDEL